MLKKTIALFTSTFLLCTLAGCGSSSEQSSASTGGSEKTSAAVSSGTVSDTTQSSTTSSESASFASKLNISDLFSKRDLEQTADLSSAKTIQAVNNSTETITEEGVYVIQGSASNFTLRVEAAKEAKIQLVLDGVSVTNDSTPVIYVVSADKCFVTTTDSTNTLSVTGSFTADGSTNTDAVIYCKDDLVLNGTGTLIINSATGNGISGKDEIKITDGTYQITSALDSIEANDSIAVYDGTIDINSSKDGFHAENSDDDSVGWVYIRSGTLTIQAKSDAIQATTVAQIDGGTLNLSGTEGIEGTYIQLNNGSITINATDDGINAGQKSKTFGTPTIKINGGNLNVTVGQGDTDAIDANGDIIVNGGTINVIAPTSSFDYDGTATYNGGTIIINGTQVDSIPQSMMGGRGGMGGKQNRF